MSPRPGVQPAPRGILHPFVLLLSAAECGTRQTIHGPGQETTGASYTEPPWARRPPDYYRCCGLSDGHRCRDRGGVAGCKREGDVEIITFECDEVVAGSVDRNRPVGCIRTELSCISVLCNDLARLVIGHRDRAVGPVHRDKHGAPARIR